MKKALLLVSLLSVFSTTTLVFFAPQISAQKTQKNIPKNIRGGDVNQEFKQVFEEANGKDTNFAKTSFYSLKYTAFGLIYMANGKPAGSDGGDFADAGAIGAVGKMIAFTYTQPASVETYIADVLQNMNIAQPVYAQGLGFSALQPVLNLWKIFRDISYVFFVFIFLIIGFAIMFRKNLGGQAAVTVQQALPRIIVALLAVSFSYAIAGLLIDFMWILMYFLVTMFKGANLLPADYIENYSILNMNIFDVFTGIIGSNVAGESGTAVGKFVNDIIANNGGLSNFLGGLANGLTSILATLIIFIAIIFAMFKTFFALIKVYFEIIMSVIFAPIALMMGAINGNAFGNWVKSLVVNLAVFPVMLVFIIIGFMLISPDTNAPLAEQLQETGFIPPFIPGRSAADTVGFVGGIAAIMFLPEVVGFVTKNKPSSIFDEIAPKAFQNAMTGNQLAAPGALALGGGLYGAGRGAVSAYRQGATDWKDYLGAIYRGQTVVDPETGKKRTVGGLKPAGLRMFGVGKKVAGAIDRGKSGELLDPSIITRQIDEYAERQRKINEEVNRRTEEANSPQQQRSNPSRGA